MRDADRSDLFCIAQDWHETHRGESLENAVRDCEVMYDDVDWDEDKRDHLLYELKYLRGEV
jgi:hypothetical protein